MSTESDTMKRIGGVLLDILPSGAASITADTEADEGYGSVAFIVRHQDGNTYAFPDDENYPEVAESAVLTEVLDLWKAMAADGQDHWYTAKFTADRDGKFDVNFGYDRPEN